MFKNGSTAGYIRTFPGACGLQSEGMKLILNIFAAAALGVSLCIGGALAVESEETKSERTEEQSRKDGAEKKRPNRTRDDLDSCKRDAEGMKGPERARFMTECLRER